MKIKTYIIVTILSLLALGAALVFSNVSNAQLSGGGGTIGQLEQWRSLGGYLVPRDANLGLKVPGLATSTTGCLSVASSGIITANGSACGSGSGSGFSTTSANYWKDYVSTLPGLVSFGSSTATTTALGNLTAIGYVQLGTTTTAMLNGVIVVDGVHYAQTGTGIQGAINTCSSIQTCKAVDLANTTATISSTITVPSNITVFSSGTSTLYDGAKLSNGMFKINGANNVTIKNITFVISHNSKAILSTGDDHLLVENIDVSGNAEDAIEFLMRSPWGVASSTNAVIRDNYFHDMASSTAVIYFRLQSGFGADLYGAEHPTIQNNKFVKTRGPAILVGEGQPFVDAVIDNNKFIDLQDAGIGQDGRGVAFNGGVTVPYKIVGLKFTNNYHENITNTTHQGGIYIYQALDTVIDNNTFVGIWSTTTPSVVGEAIAPGLISHPDRDIRVTNNTIKGYEAWIDPDSMYGADISNNHIENTGMNIWLGYNIQKNISIHDNTFIGNVAATNTAAAFVVANCSDYENVSVHNNSVVYLNATSNPIYLLREQCGKNHSDVRIFDNSFYSTSTPTGYIIKELGTETSPTDIFNNKLVSSTTIDYNLGSFSNGGLLFLGATTTGAQTVNTKLMQNPLLFWDNTNDRLGIGTTTPPAPLSIYASTNDPALTEFTNLSVFDPSSGRYDYFKFLLGANSARGGKIVFGENGAGFPESGVTFSLNKTTIYQGGNNPLVLGTNAIEQVYVLGSGYVGIGTTSPYAKLSVAGPTVAEYFHATNTAATSTFAGGFKLSSLNCSGLSNGGALTVNASGEVVCTADDSGAGGTNYWATAGSDVFINTGSSASAPTLVATSTANPALTVGDGTTGYFKLGDATVNKRSGNFFSFNNDGVQGVEHLVIGNDSPNISDSLVVETDAFVISSTKKVGIGTTSPYAALSVVGSTGVVAEKYSATGTATSTFAWDINIASGHCIQYNGSCISLTGSGSYPFTPTSYNGEVTSATSSPVRITGNLYASSTTRLATTTTYTLNGVIYADQMPGADIGAKINNAYAFLPTHGGTIVVPTGFYSFSTAISLSTAGKRALIQCANASSTTLFYTGSATSTTINWGGGNVGNEDHEFGSGIDGCTFRGSDDTFDTSVGIVLGGSNGAEGVRITNTRITNFQKGLVVVDNTWNTSVHSSILNGSGRNFVFEATTNAGENLSFVSTVFADNYNAAASTSVYIKCVDLSKGGVGVSFVNSAFDDCQVYAGNASTLSFTNPHFENPASDGAGNKYTPIYIEPSEYTNVSIQGGLWVQGATAQKPDSFIYNGGHLVVNGFTARDAGGGVVNYFVVNNNVNGGGSVSINGLSNVGGSAFTDVSPNDPSGFDPTADGSRFIQSYIQTQDSYPYIQAQSLAGALSLFNGNTQAMVIGSTGLVGIGTSTPVARLHVNGSGWFGPDTGGLSAAAGRGVRIFEDDTVPVGSIFAYDYYNGTALNLVLQAPGGNLGIGTTSPNAKFSIAGAAGGKMIQWITSVGTNMLDIVNDTATAVLKGTWDFSGATVKQHVYKGITWPGVATTTTATTSVPIGQAMVPTDFEKSTCRVTSGSGGYQFSDGTNKTTYRAASTTASRYTVTTNDTWVVDENMIFDVGPLTNAQITCGIDMIQN